MGQKKKNIQLIFLYLIFYGLSVGIWSEFTQLWLNEQNISIANIGVIVASASFVAGLIIIGITKYTKKINELIIVKIAFLSKILLLVGMVLGYEFGIKWMSISSFIADSILNNLIVLITYPLLSHIVKDEKIYSKRKLVEYTATDIGLLISSFIVGKSIGSFVFNYNVLIMISMIFVIGAIISVFFIKNSTIFKVKEKANFKDIFDDKILNIYLIYHFIGQIAYMSGLGMQLLLIVNYANFTASTGALFIVVCCILGDIFGYIALKKLTPKNDYVTICIKFVIRFIFYTILIIVPIKEILLTTIFVSLFVSRAYENKTDAIYVNRCKKSEMFTFANIRYGVTYIGKAIGTLICGFTFELGLRCIFGVCIGFMAIQILMAFGLIKMRHDEEKRKNQDFLECQTNDENSTNQK